MSATGQSNPLAAASLPLSGAADGEVPTSRPPVPLVLASPQGRCTGHAAELGGQLLRLMIPFPRTREELRANTLEALGLLRGLTNEEVAEATSGGAFFERVTERIPQSEIGSTVASTYFKECTGEGVMPNPDTVNWEDVDVLRFSGLAFDCAETAWQQWLRFPLPEVDLENQPRTKELFGQLLPYEFNDPITGQPVGHTAVAGQPVGLQMCPRVTLLSALLRANGLRCPQDMRFASLFMANLAGVQLSSHVHKVDLRGSWLFGSVLAGGKFSVASMRGVHAGQASMQNGEFKRTDLTDASTYGADRRGAFLERTNLNGCFINGGLWDPPPSLPRPNTRSFEPLGICRMVCRSILSSAADDDEDEQHDDVDLDEAEDLDVTDNTNCKSTASDGAKEDDWVVEGGLDMLLAEFVDATQLEACETLVQRLKDRKHRNELFEKLEAEMGILAGRKKQIEIKSRQLSTSQAANKVGLVLDIKTLRGQYKTFKKVVAGDQDIHKKEEELIVLLMLWKEMINAIARIEERLQVFGKAKDSKAFERWVQKMNASYKIWLHSDKAPLVETRIGALLTTTLERSSAYNIGLTDFTAMMSIDARVLAEDRKELEMLATKLDELLVPITALNWEDVLNSWLALIQLHGKLYGSRAQAIVQQLFDNRHLMNAIGMANQCRLIKAGENGNLIPSHLIQLFKEGTTATLRRDEFTYVRGINKEIANIDRVSRRQAQFVAFLGSVTLSVFVGVSNLLSMLAYDYMQGGVEGS